MTLSAAHLLPDAGHRILDDLARGPLAGTAADLADESVDEHSPRGV